MMALKLKHHPFIISLLLLFCVHVKAQETPSSVDLGVRL